MSYRAIVETNLCLDHFRNVDLFQQGYYQIRVQLFHEKDGYVRLDGEGIESYCQPVLPFLCGLERGKERVILLQFLF